MNTQTNQNQAGERTQPTFRIGGLARFTALGIVGTVRAVTKKYVALQYAEGGVHHYRHAELQAL